LVEGIGRMRRPIAFVAVFLLGVADAVAANSPSSSLSSEEEEDTVMVTCFGDPNRDGNDDEDRRSGRLGSQRKSKAVVLSIKWLEVLSSRSRHYYQLLPTASTTTTTTTTIFNNNPIRQALHSSSGCCSWQEPLLPPLLVLP